MSGDKLNANKDDIEQINKKLDWIYYIILEGLAATARGDNFMRIQRLFEHELNPFKDNDI